MGDCNCKHGASGAGGVCVECDIAQLSRNNYFTGKLLVERDFTDEQRYLMGKQRRHNQRLHGWGAVCGLKVEPHPTCPDRYVIIEPGTAIDCCGREILVSAQEYFGFEAQFLANWQKQNGPNSQPDPTVAHKIQICVSYNECGTEDIPALFDDCSCDATSCQPNRILESYGFDVLIDPRTTGTDGQSIEVNWSCTIGLANVVRVAANDATKRLYVLTSDSTAKTATLYVVDATNDSILASQSFPKNTGLDAAVSPSGDFVYVALQPTTVATAQPQILVMATSDLTTTINTLSPVGASGDAIRLAVAPMPDGRLLAVVPSANNVLVWKTDINGPNPPPPAAATPVTVGANPISIAISDNGLYAYVANSGSGATNPVSAIALTSPTLTVTPVTAGVTGSTPAAVAVASTTAGDALAVLDATNKTLYFISIPNGGPGSATAIGNPVTTFAYPPIDVRLSPAGRWAYVLEQDSAAAKTGYVQVVDAHAVQLSSPNILGAPVSVGIQPIGETLSDDGTHLYVWYSGDGKSIPGGVAILNVVQDGCCGLFNQTIEGCPDCPDGNCIVLATINGYKYGQPVGLTDIDNLTDRHLLVSTDILTQAVQCLCEQGGAAGTPGPQGAPGLPGPGLETGLVQITALSWVHGGSMQRPFVMIPQKTMSGSITAAANASGGTTAYTGTFAAALPVGFQVMIIGFTTNPNNNGTFVVVSCTNNQLVVANPKGVAETTTEGEAFVNPVLAFVIAFNGQLSVPPPLDNMHIFDPHIFQVLIDPTFGQDQRVGYENPCAFTGYVLPVTATVNNNLVTAAAPITTTPTSTQAIAFIFDSTTLSYTQIVDGPSVILDTQIRLRGDFLFDTNKPQPRAISAEFVRAQFPTGERPQGSGLCLEGGTFESWVSVSVPAG